MTNSILKPYFVLNIFIHVAILFTILSQLFSKFISKVTTNAINNKIQYIVNDSLSPYNIYKQKLLKKYNELKKTVKETDSRLQNIKLLLDKIPTNTNTNTNTNIPNIPNIPGFPIKSSIGNPINTNTNIPNIPNIPSFPIDDLIKNIDGITYDYYLKLFSKEDRTRLISNNHVFNKIMMVNIIIVIFVIIISGLFVYNNIVSLDEFKHILVDNIVTFIFVGIVEVIFFLNIARGFIPAQPSLIFASFIDSMKDQFKVI